MNKPFESVEEAFLALANPGGPDWAQAFGFLAAHPQTAQAMMDTFRDTLAQMGAEASGTDPGTGEPVYSLQDVARALGVPQSDLDAAMGEADPDHP